MGTTVTFVFNKPSFFLLLFFILSFVFTFFFDSFLFSSFPISLFIFYFYPLNPSPTFSSPFLSSALFSHKIGLFKVFFLNKLHLCNYSKQYRYYCCFNHYISADGLSSLLQSYNASGNFSSFISSLVNSLLSHENLERKGIFTSPETSLITSC